jgi:hypothetical protein
VLLLEIPYQTGGCGDLSKIEEEEEDYLNIFEGYRL